MRRFTSWQCHGGDLCFQLKFCKTFATLSLCLMLLSFNLDECLDCWKLLGQRGCLLFSIMSQTFPSRLLLFLFHRRQTPECTAIAVGNKIETLLSFSFCSRAIVMEIFLRLSEIQGMNLGMSVIKTQEALIIKIAHKTVSNTIFMLLLLVVNSNCYCGHLRRRDDKVELVQMSRLGERLLMVSLHDENHQSFMTRKLTLQPSPKHSPRTFYLSAGDRRKALAPAG